MRCGYRYGPRRQLVCRRLAGHRGYHATRSTIKEIAIMLKRGKK